MSSKSVSLWRAYKCYLEATGIKKVSYLLSSLLQIKYLSKASPRKLHSAQFAFIVHHDSGVELETATHKESGNRHMDVTAQLASVLFFFKKFSGRSW